MKHLPDVIHELDQKSTDSKIRREKDFFNLVMQSEVIDALIKLIKVGKPPTIVTKSEYGKEFKFSVFLIDIYSYLSNLLEWRKK
jgi:superfamily II helicase